MIKKIRTKLQNLFIAGLLVLLPISITVFILTFVFQKLDNLLSPAFVKLLILFGLPLQRGQFIPGLGFVATIIIIVFTGLITKNILGRKLFSLGEIIVERIPVARSIYSGAKQIIDAVSKSQLEAFNKVVMVEYPRKGLFSLGFVTCEARGEIQEYTKENVVNVFIPTTPNPTSGLLIFVPKEDIIPLSMTVEEGIKLVVSGGIVTPIKNNNLQQAKELKS
tara:strand:- start:6514 stop:7176 length:663 start_codon:yes stop_codon:yes gene_type:complete